MRSALLTFVCFVYLIPAVNAQLAASITNSQNPACAFQCNGSVTISVTGATGNHYYNLTGGVEPATITGDVITGLCGDYYMLVTTDDANIDSDTLYFNLTDPDYIFMDPFVANNYCERVCMSQVFANTFGGTGELHYTWEPAVTTGEWADNLCPGNYTITVTDDAGCTRSAEVPVEIHQDLFISLTATNTTCSSACDGVIEPSMYGGVFPYSYTWSYNSNGYPEGVTLTHVCAGYYYIYGTDGNGCEVIDSVEVLEGTHNLSDVTATLTPVNESCPFASDGSMSLMLGGTNTGPFTYLWSNDETTQNISGIISGNYSVIIYDGAMNCFSVNDDIHDDGCEARKSNLSQTHNDMPGNWEIYPNPSSGTLYLTLTSGMENGILQVINSIGQPVYEETASDNKAIDLSRFSNGIYFVKISSNQQTHMKRFVLNK